MSKKSQAPTEQGKETKKRTPTFLLELPLQVNEGQAARLRAHLEAGRQFYNAVLSEGQKRLRRMRADPTWQQARAIPEHRNRSAPEHFRRCASSTDFPSMACMKQPNSCVSAGSLSTSTLSSPKPWQVEPTAHSFVSIWDKPAASASKIGCEASPASKTSAMIPGSVLCCKSRRKGIRVFSFGKTTNSRRSSTKPKVPTHWGFAMLSNWSWKGCRTTSRNIL